MAKAAGLVNRHYHPHQVFAYTISGKWGYLEHEWTATAGDFIYEPPGESHTLVAYDTGAGWHYFPSLGEMTVTVGLIAFEVLAIIIAIRLLPILPAARPDSAPRTS